VSLFNLRVSNILLITTQCLLLFFSFFFRHLNYLFRRKSWMKLLHISVNVTSSSLIKYIWYGIVSLCLLERGRSYIEKIKSSEQRRTTRKQGKLAYSKSDSQLKHPQVRLRHKIVFETKAREEFVNEQGPPAVPMTSMGTIFYKQNKINSSTWIWHFNSKSKVFKLDS
jgi:hypothetical protein